MINLSATIITLNEERNLPACLKFLESLVDEVIVVDSGSRDRTVEIAKELGARVYYHNFDNYADQKNWALSKARGRWILAVDADERIPPKLAEEIKQAVNSTEYVGFLIPRRNFILGAEIKHSRWSPDKHVWLWRKGYGEWMGNVHEEVVVNGKTGELKEAKIHYQDKTIAEFINTNDRYSTLQARGMFTQGIKFSFLKMLHEALFEFFVRFVYKKGFLDGWRGLALASMMFFYKISVWWKLFRLETSPKKR